MLNDLGQVVLQVGAPGSPARVRAERPGLIERINSIHAAEGGIDEAIDEIRSAGITSAMETRSILEVSLWGDELPGWL